MIVKFSKPISLVVVVLILSSSFSAPAAALSGNENSRDENSQLLQDAQSMLLLNSPGEPNNPENLQQDNSAQILSTPPLENCELFQYYEIYTTYDNGQAYKKMIIYPYDIAVLNEAENEWVPYIVTAGPDEIKVLSPIGLTTYSAFGIMRENHNIMWRLLEDNQVLDLNYVGLSSKSDNGIFEVSIEYDASIGRIWFVEQYEPRKPVRSLLRVLPLGDADFSVQYVIENNVPHMGIWADAAVVDGLLYTWSAPAEVVGNGSVVIGWAEDSYPAGSIVEFDPTVESPSYLKGALVKTTYSPTSKLSYIFLHQPDWGFPEQPAYRSYAPMAGVDSYETSVTRGLIYCQIPDDLKNAVSATVNSATFEFLWSGTSSDGATYTISFREATMPAGAAFGQDFWDYSPSHSVWNDYVSLTEGTQNFTVSYTGFNKIGTETKSVASYVQSNRSSGFVGFAYVSSGEDLSKWNEFWTKGEKLTITYTVRYTVTTSVSPSGAGTASASPTGPYTAGTPVTLTASPASGYTFSNWSGYLSGSTNPKTFTMPAQNVSVTANFSPITYTLTTSASPSGSGTVSPSSGSYPAGTQVTLTASPASGYTFSNWSEYLSGSTNPMTFTMPAHDVSVTANFSVPPPTSPTAPRNLTATPGNGQVILTWVAPLSDGGSSITGYRIYRGTSSGGETFLTGVGGGTLTYTDTGLTNGTTYYYQVSAVNSGGEGPRSSEASATPVRTFNIAVILARPLDVPPFTQGAAFWTAFYNQRLTDMDVYYDEVSYHSIAFNWQIFTNGGNWYQVYSDAQFYGVNDPAGEDDTSTFIAEAILAAWEDVNFNLFDIIAVVFPGVSEQETHLGGTTDDMTILYTQLLTWEAFSVSQTGEVGHWAHEVGHALGNLLTDTFLPDRFAAAGGGDIGDWGLMGHGVWAGVPPGNQPVHLCSFSKEFLGWLNYQNISLGWNNWITALPNLDIGNNVYRYMLNNQDYYILEVRTKDGRYSQWDRRVPIVDPDIGGLVVYKVESGGTVVNVVPYVSSYCRVGEILVDSLNNVQFSVLMSNAGTDIYQMRVSVASAGTTGRTVGATTPTSPWGMPGGFGAPLIEPQWPDLDLHAYTFDGRHVGMNYETGTYEMEIPGTITSGDLQMGTEWISVPSSEKVYFVTTSRDAQEFLNEFPGTEIENASYAFYNVFYDEQGGRYESENISREIAPGENQNFTYEITANLGGGYSVQTIADNTPPSSSLDGIDPYYRASVPFTITATASDDLSGVAKVELWYRYSTDNVTFGPWTSFGVDTASPWSWLFTAPSRDGYYEFYSIATDNAGNVENAPYEAEASCKVVDTTPPATTSSLSGTAGNAGWWVSNVTVTLSSTDAMSGVSYTKYTVDGGAEQTYSAPFTVSGDGTHTVQYYSVDVAGNQESTKSVMINIDTTPPAGFDLLSPENNASFYNKTPTLTWQASSDNGSGLDHYEVWLDSSNVDNVDSRDSSLVNLTLGRPVTASSTETSGLEPEKAVDNNLGTRWSSEFSDPQWICVDLGQPVGITGVVLRWETAYGKSYQIQVSDDAVDWTTIYSTTSGDGGVDNISGLGASGRYVRMYGTQRGTGWGYSLWEFEVYSGCIYTTPELSNGTHDWYVVAVDAVGNKTESDSTFNFTIAMLGWWNTNWAKRRPLTITGTHPDDYQLKVVIPSDIAKSDYPSIRFLENETSGLLPYWIENVENSYSNVAWVRRPTYEDNTIYMYYKNPNAASASNGDTTFMFFDDFGGGNGGQDALNKSKWGASDTGVDVYATYLRLEDWSNNAGWVQHQFPESEINERRIVEFRIKNTSTWRGGVRLVGSGDWYNNGDGREMWGIYRDGWPSGSIKFFSDGGTDIQLEGSKWYVGGLVFYGDSRDKIGAYIYYGEDNENYRQLVGQKDPMGPGWTWWKNDGNWFIDKYKPMVWDGGGDSTYYYDWFIVRKWTETEPSVEVRDEQ